MSAAGDTELAAIGPDRINQFLVPEAMLTPGIAGGTIMVIANALAFNFGVPNYRSSLGLLLSFMFGTLVITSQRQWWTRIIYYVINSLIIFCVAFGAGNLAATSNLDNVKSVNLVFPSAYAQSASRVSPDFNRTNDETARGSDQSGEKENPPDRRDNSSRDLRHPGQRSNSFFQPWTNPFTK
jgi:hypothetical protein